MMRRINNERGSALVLVTLLTLILSAFAIVALRDVARSSQQAAVFQTRHQSQMTSYAATTAVGKRVGDKAANVYKRMQATLLGEDGGGVQNLLGGAGTGATAMTTRREVVAKGPYTIYRDTDFAFLYNDGTRAYLFSPNPDLGTNPTGPGSARPSFEEQRGSNFRTIIRDPLDAQAASGYSEDFCFKKVTIASEATVGESDDNWKGSNNMARSRNGMEGLIGPIECGY